MDDPATSAPDDHPAAGHADLRVSYVAGLLPEKWLRRFTERSAGETISATVLDPAAQWQLLDDGGVDLAFVRLGPEDAVDTEVLHCIRLYEEQPGVAAPKGHEIQVVEQVSSAELEEEREVPLQPTAAETLALVAAGVGIWRAPRPLLRFLNVDGVVHRELTDGEITTIAVVWPKAQDSDLIQEFIGIVRGRRVGSTRQPSAVKAAAQAQTQPTQKRKKPPAAKTKPAAKKPQRPGRRKRR